MTETIVADPLTIGSRTVIGTAVLKPETRSEVPPVWTSGSLSSLTEEQRTFFVSDYSDAGGGYMTLIVSTDDPRSESMWVVDEKHRGWNVQKDALDFTPFNEDPAAKDGLITSLREEITAKAEEITRLNLLVEQIRSNAREAMQRHEEDIEKISDQLIEEAESRDWCGEYDQIVSNLNRRLSVPLRERTREYEVTLDVTYRVTVTVEAPSEEKAAEQAEEDGEWEISTYDTPETIEVYSTMEN